MTLIVRAFPVKSKAAAVKFAGEVKKRNKDARKFFKDHSVRHESWYFQKGPNGPIVIGVTDVAEEPSAVGERFAGAETPFATWFKKRVLEISGVDENAQPLGPDTEKIFEFDA